MRSVVTRAIAVAKRIAVANRCALSDFAGFQP